MKRIISIVFVLSIFMGMVGCMSDSEKNEYDYPEHLTAEYCYNNYSPMSPNYINSYAYENAAEGIHKDPRPYRYFYAIPKLIQTNFWCA